MKTGIFAIIAAVFLSAVSALPAGEIKVGVVDMGKLISAHPDRSRAETILQKQASEFEEEYKAMEKEREKVKVEFEKVRDEMDNKTLNEDARRAKLKEAEEKIADIKKIEIKMRETGLNRRQQLADEKRRMQGQVVEKIRKIVSDYARKNDYTMILDSASVGMQGVESVIYSEEKMDVTEDVLKLVATQKE